MEWQKLGRHIHLFRMLWLHEDGSWFAGIFGHHNVYGQCVRTDEEEYIDISRITHYMIITTN